MPDDFKCKVQTKITLRWRYYLWLVPLLILRAGFPDFNWRSLIVHMMRRCCKVNTSLEIIEKGNESDDNANKPAA